MLVLLSLAGGTTSNTGPQWQAGGPHTTPSGATHHTTPALQPLHGQPPVQEEAEECLGAGGASR